MTPRQQRARAGALGIGIQARYRTLIDAQLSGDQDAVFAAAIPLADVMNRNADFIMFVLRKFAGHDVRPPETVAEALTMGEKPVFDLVPANDLPTTPAIFSAGADVDKGPRR